MLFASAPAQLMFTNKQGRGRNRYGHCGRDTDNPPPLTTKTPSRDKIRFTVNYLRFAVNVVPENDGSTVHGVFHVMYTTPRKMS